MSRICKQFSVSNNLLCPLLKCFCFSFVGEFGNFREKSRNPQHEFGRMAEINMVVRHAERQIPPVPHWRFCYVTLRNNFNLGALILHQFDIDLRNAVSYLPLLKDTTFHVLELCFTSSCA